VDVGELIEQASAWLEAIGSVGAVLERATLDEQAAIIAGAMLHVVPHKGADPTIVWQPWAAALLERPQSGGFDH
jgi:hypothetical protein